MARDKEVASGEIISRGMSKFLIFKLKPRSFFHFGERGIGIEETDEVFHSDSLFSAFCCAWREIKGDEELKRILDEFQNKPPFLLSSAFPFAEEILFFPKPLLYLPSLEDRNDFKLNDIRFVSQRILEAILNVEDLSIYANTANLLQDGTLWLSGEERRKLTVERIWKKDLVPRVTVDRVKSLSTYFEAGSLRFNQRCGLFFLIKLFSQDSLALVEEALNYLTDAGIGGERCIGYGQFYYEKGEIELKLPSSAEAFITLSLYHPTKEEVEAGILYPPASYHILKRSGWICSPEMGTQRRKNVRMLVEGSFFKGSPNKLYGDLVDLTPQGGGWHKVYRYGYAFPLFFYPKEV